MKQLIRIGLILLAAGVAQSQQAPAPVPAKEQAPAVKDAEQERASLKARLERRLAEDEQSIARTKDALARLNKGESAESVQRSLGPQRRGGGGPEGNGTHRNEPPPKVEASDRDMVMGFLAEHSPDLATRIKAQQKDNPPSAERTIGRLAPHIREALTERDPELRQLRIADLRAGWETMSAMRALIDALRKDPAGVEARTAEVKARELLAVQFDTQVKLRNREITTLEERIAQIRQELSEKLGEKDGYVAQRIKFAQERAKQPAQRGREKSETPSPAPSTETPKR